MTRKEGTMNLCNAGHDEVCFDGRLCPVCEAQLEIDRLERETEDLRNEIKEWEQASIKVITSRWICEEEMKQA